MGWHQVRCTQCTPQGKCPGMAVPGIRSLCTYQHTNLSDLILHIAFPCSVETRGVWGREVGVPVHTDMGMYSFVPLRHIAVLSLSNPSYYLYNLLHSHFYTHMYILIIFVN